MNTTDYFNEFPAHISICDEKGELVWMNAAETQFFKGMGGADLIGQSMQNCHTPGSWIEILNLIQSQEMRVYTVVEHGKRELILVGPWYHQGSMAGLVEISLEINGEIPELVRG